MEDKKKFFDKEALAELINQIKEADNNVKAFAGNLEGKVDNEGNPFTSVQAYLEDLILKAEGGDGGATAELIGVLTNLTTTAKENLVAAINEVDANIKAIEIPNTDDFTTSDEFELITKQDIINMFNDNINISIELVIDNIYHMGGYDWECVKEIENGYTLQSYGVTTGYWPGNPNAEIGAVDQDCCYQDIHEYDDKMNLLYNEIKNAENGNNGLYLVSAKRDCNIASNGNQASGVFCNGLMTAAERFRNTVPYACSWTGSVTYDNFKVVAINEDGFGIYRNQDEQGVVAPAFDIDSSMISVDSNNNITIKESNNIVLDRGQIYQMAGYDWICLSKIKNGYILLNTGIEEGPYPGQNETDSSGLDISNYSEKASKLYSQIKIAEYNDANYGKGLYLISEEIINTKSEYQKAFKKCKSNSWVGCESWFDDYDNRYIACYFDKVNGQIEQWDVYGPFNIALAFNLDASKVHLEGTEIIIN